MALIIRTTPGTTGFDVRTLDFDARIAGGGLQAKDWTGLAQYVRQGNDSSARQ